MDYGWIIPVLALLTFGIVLVFALTSKAKTESDRADPRDPKSTLAKDGPNGGVAFLKSDAAPDTTAPPAVAKRP